MAVSASGLEIGFNLKLPVFKRISILVANLKLVNCKIVIL